MRHLSFEYYIVDPMYHDRDRFSIPTLSFEQVVRRSGPSEYDYEPIQHYIAGASERHATVLEDFSATASGSVMIVKVDGGIIPSDDDIFASPFVDFLAHVINAQDGERGGSNRR